MTGAFDTFADYGSVKAWLIVDVDSCFERDALSV